MCPNLSPLFRFVKQSETKRRGLTHTATYVHYRSISCVFIKYQNTDKTRKDVDASSPGISLFYA